MTELEEQREIAIKETREWLRGWDADQREMVLWILQEEVRDVITNRVDEYNNRGNEMREQGRLDDAIESYKQALKINPEYPEANYNMGIVLTDIVFTKPMPELNEIVCKLLDKEKSVRPSDLSTAVISLLKFDPIIKDVFSKIYAGGLSGSLQEIIVDLSNVPLLIKLMGFPNFLT